mmetsp:Transcript_138856/g.252742  ORF Transcript_138856/g.252742 Transcript_138856/m.252742 type:complete len:366 (-) Transcript_138856:135-1232(-)
MVVSEAPGSLGSRLAAWGQTPNNAERTGLLAQQEKLRHEHAQLLARVASETAKSEAAEAAMQAALAPWKENKDNRRSSFCSSLLQAGATLDQSAEVTAWQKSFERLQHQSQVVASVASKASGLATATLEAQQLLQDQELDAKLEAEELRLRILQRNEAIANAELRIDEARRAELQTELQAAEAEAMARLNGSPSRRAVPADAGAAGSSPKKLLSQLVSREGVLVTRAQQERDALRETLVQVRDQVACSEAEVSLLRAARDSANVLLNAGPEYLHSKLESLKQAILRTQEDIEALNAAGREAAARSADLDMQLWRAEAELKAEQLKVQLSELHAKTCSRATSEHWRLSQHFRELLVQAKQDVRTPM